jgi:hypothetical protein
MGARERADLHRSGHPVLHAWVIAAVFSPLQNVDLDFSPPLARHRQQLNVERGGHVFLFLFL